MARLSQNEIEGKDNEMKCKMRADVDPKDISTGIHFSFQESFRGPIFDIYIVIIICIYGPREDSLI